VPPPSDLADLAAATSDDVEDLTAAAAAQVDTTRINGDPNQWRDEVAGAGENLLTLQRVAVELAPRFVAGAMLAQGADDTTDATVNTQTFVDFTDGGGSWLRNLVYAPPATFQQAIAQGFAAQVANLRGAYAARAIIENAMRDAHRSAVGTAMATTRAAKGYVRALRGTSCARCAILAGRRYRVAAFQRHPRCDCYMIPAAEDAPGSWATDPDRYFRRLSTADQDRLFTKAGAQAIRLGADIAQVVNARDGIEVVSAFGRDIETTTTGTTVRGLAGSRLAAEGVAKSGGRYRAATTARLTPDEIFQLAEREGWDKAEVLRQLYRYGYVI
jgi:hypothetical protein